MYGKLFSQMYDGTLVGDWKALVTFQQMIVLCDSDGVLDMTPIAISNRTGIPLEVIEAGIKILEEPDEYSRTPDCEGRRIERLEEHRNWGWSIVNHEKYRAMRGRDEIREQNRLRKQRQREKLKNSNENNDVTRCDACVTERDQCDKCKKSRHAYTDANTGKQLKSKSQAIDDPFFGSVNKKITKDQAEKIIELYAEILPELQQVVISLFHGKPRARALAARWAEHEDFRTEEFWRAFFSTVRTSKHWMGDNDRGWMADFEFLMKPSNFSKCCEIGGYGQ